MFLIKLPLLTLSPSLLLWGGVTSLNFNLFHNGAELIKADDAVLVDVSGLHDLLDLARREELAEPDHAEAELVDGDAAVVVRVEQAEHLNHLVCSALLRCLCGGHPCLGPGHRAERLKVDCRLPGWEGLLDHLLGDLHPHGEEGVVKLVDGEQPVPVSVELLERVSETLDVGHCLVFVLFLFLLK